jgi:hypothetical protein
MTAASLRVVKLQSTSTSSNLALPRSVFLSVNRTQTGSANARSTISVAWGEILRQSVIYFSRGFRFPRPDRLLLRAQIPALAIFVGQGEILRLSVSWSLHKLILALTI